MTDHWHPGDEPPVTSRRVLIYTREHGHELGYFDLDRKKWAVYEMLRGPRESVVWMPLPPPPTPECDECRHYHLGMCKHPHTIIRKNGAWHVPERGEARGKGEECGPDGNLFELWRPGRGDTP